MAHGQIATDKKRVGLIMPQQLWDSIVISAKKNNVSASVWITQACQQRINEELLPEATLPESETMLNGQIMTQEEKDALSVMVQGMQGALEILRKCQR